jgi:hypothetical protein
MTKDERKKIKQALQLMEQHCKCCSMCGSKPCELCIVKDKCHEWEVRNILHELVTSPQQPRRSTSIASLFNLTFGGTWKYDCEATWWCDDKKRHISRCSPGVDEFDNPVGPPVYYLYEDGQSPQLLSITGLRLMKAKSHIKNISHLIGG